MGARSRNPHSPHNHAPSCAATTLHRHPSGKYLSVASAPGSQAEDRCHRLGQKKPVTVIRLITSGTVDEDIHAIAQRKLRLDAAVLEGLGEGATLGESSVRGKGSGEAQTMGVILKAIIAGRSVAAEENLVAVPIVAAAKSNPPQVDGGHNHMLQESKIAAAASEKVETIVISP